jgi:hypothetical protein
MMKMMSGGSDLHDEAHLMVIETRNDYHNPTVSWFRKWNYVGHRTFFLTAITRSKEEET